MKQRMFEYAIQVASAAVCFGAIVNSSTAGSFTRGCASAWRLAKSSSRS